MKAALQHMHDPNVDYSPLRIRIYRNGDIYDEGRGMTVTRREFKHWIVFLDAVTARLDTRGAVRKLYSTHGIPIQHFDELEQNGETRWTRRAGQKFTPIVRISQEPPNFLHSAETVDIYLKKEGFGSITGLPYPFDGILTRSPSASMLHLKHFESHQAQIPKLKIGGSMEHLNVSGGNSRRIYGDDSPEKKKEEKDERLEADAAVQPMETNLEKSQSNVEKADQSEKNKSTRLPRLVQTNRSCPPTKRAESKTRQAEAALPPIYGGCSKERLVEIRVEKEPDKSEESQGEELQKVAESTAVTSRKSAVADEEVRYHKSYVLTEMTITSQVEQRPVKGAQKEVKAVEVIQSKSSGQTTEQKTSEPTAASQAFSTSNSDTADDIEDMIRRARLWEKNKRRMNMRQQFTQTVRSETKRRYELFDPDFD
ncbi:unnamed protein product [Caenorhabditis auriculariae]|uniref:Doublecortin domain-containing protein n=1 Tax=Caenorhabditis auriculariae TaxID=2777116 RepID=A0A8S1HSL2_9PELO|nr:unnamed protein product [Caenorhabditis auriculariae]